MSLRQNESSADTIAGWFSPTLGLVTLVTAKFTTGRHILVQPLKKVPARDRTSRAGRACVAQRASWSALTPSSPPPRPAIHPPRANIWLWPRRHSSGARARLGYGYGYGYGHGL